ncbi:hypothetical protein DSM106972_038130 [Dulcicalothrix desertica PCC 7102]|uniref:Leucine rich repeat variant domain-containing protein n=1 Tax=Dulcicalothrix desertica PCC 7102 TaxID=232991 RepID=A0A3S1IZG3_9CYAN|nr:hypothetical protein [Dulcicalothrix desertica]RUT04992.1 hypothetical protein DSM106972_038130 [Dulcicalothrix desertica PCC 7102]TWH43442.1 hypothetical protein CAL7102_07164 [Dulcicalothrix desertica PCC 7102]
MSDSLIKQAADINTHPDRLRDLADFCIELARVVAKNPSAPPDVLEVLSGYQHDPEIQRNVTTNPNTPSEVLIALGADFPSELINNPVFPLLVLEKPSLFQEMPLETLLTLSSKRKKGYSNIRAHAIKALIQKDPKKAGAVLAEFVSSDEPTSPRFIFLLHPLAPAEFLEKHANSVCWIERYAVAQNLSTPAHVLSLTCCRCESTGARGSTRKITSALSCVYFGYGASYILI